MRVRSRGLATKFIFYVYGFLRSYFVPFTTLVARFTRYEAMNGIAKCRKWGGLGWLGGTQGHRQCHHSIQHIRLPIRV